MLTRSFAIFLFADGLFCSADGDEGDDTGDDLHGA